MFFTIEKPHVISLANGTGKGVLAASGRGPLSAGLPPEASAIAVTQRLHYSLALAPEEHRGAQLQKENARLAQVAAHAQATQAASELAQQRQTEFLALLAHELRNPLTSIRNAAELLGRIDSDDEVLLRVQAIIERRVGHISRLVDDLLDLSRISTGKLRLECSIIDLRVSVEAAVEGCRPEIERRRQRLAVTVPARPLEIHGDPVRLAQVLDNLLDNASKYTPDGGVIELLAAVEGEVILLSVCDSGIGIAPETLPRVFEPFAQGHPPNGGRCAGLGLGLAVVSDLVEAHGGSVVAHSAGCGSGSRFVVTLPLAGALPLPDST